jgi:hypothetical protein
MSNIDDLLKYEDDVVPDTRRVFDAFSPELLEALDTAMGMYATFGRVAGQGSEHQVDVDEMNACARQLGAKDDEDLQKILATPTSDPAHLALLARFHGAEDRLEAKLDRNVILLQMARAFSRSVVDLLRQRLTSAIGYQRPVVEGLAILFLTRDDPSKAIEWRKVLTDEEGREFHGKYQKAVNWIIQATDLSDAYNGASGVSLHLRFAGAVGMDFSSRRELSKEVTETRLLYGELRPGEEFYFIARVVGLLQTQVRVFARLHEAVPEARDPLWLEQRVPRFIATVEGLQRRLGTAFPRQTSRLKMRAVLGMLGKR